MPDASMENVEGVVEMDRGVPDALRKDEEFCQFDDGTITLIAEDVEFRVYKGLLARRSPVFADMFSLPQPVTLEDKTGPMRATGSDSATPPVVHLTDAPQAFRILLKAIAPDDDAAFFFLDERCECELMPLLYRMFEASHPDCFTIASCMRVGHKYQMDKVVRQCGDYLLQYFPTTYMEFDALEDLLPPGFEDDSTYVVGFINLAQLTGAIHLLPVLFMICVWCLDGDTLLQGVAWLDASNDTLSPVDLARCFDARAT